MDHGMILVSGSVSSDLELARRAEAKGFDSVYAVEFFNRHGYVTPAAIAATTERIRIGTGIANAFIRTPLLHASAAMDIDEISGGRFVLGLGSATRRMNEDWYATPFEKPAARMKELVTLLREAFAAQGGGGFRFEGEHWTIKVPIFGRPGAARQEIPICIAAVNKGMVAAAGAVADGLIGHPIATRLWHREATLPGLRAAEGKAGREAGACTLKPYLITSLAETREEAVRRAKGQIGFYLTTELYHTVLDLHGLREVGQKCREALKRFDTKAMAEAIPDALVDEIGIACTPDEAPDRLAQWADLTDEPLFYAPSVGVRPEAMRENLDAILDVFAKPV